MRGGWLVGLFFLLAAWLGGSTSPQTSDSSANPSLLAVSAATSEAATPAKAPRRRALLVGIDTYERADGEHLPTAYRGFRNLHGAAADARSLADLLIGKFGFPSDQVVVLTDHAATRAAILADFERRLIGDAREGDVVVFYFAGHGSQVPNPSSAEPDRRDESLVPVDASLGEPDLRDQEVRRLLHRLLDRGAKPTIILDSCYSGSAARGLFTLSTPRALLPARDAVHDPSASGPNPFERGALVLAAARGDEFAWETDDEQGQAHGAFTWALLRSLRDLSSGEPAEETFLRTRARLHAETRRQDPVIEGSVETQRRPLFDFEAGSAPESKTSISPSRRTVVAVERVDLDGFLILQGGWAQGLAVGSRLTCRLDGQAAQEIEIIEMLGVARSKARRRTTRSSAANSAEKPIPSGTLAEVTGWTAPQGRTLRIWLPTWTSEFAELDRLAQRLVKQASARKLTWVQDPTLDSPTHLLRLGEATAALIARDSKTTRLQPIANADALLTHVPRGARLFVQFPVAEATARSLGVGADSPHDGIEVTTDPDAAAVQLVGRWSRGSFEYAWLRPDSPSDDDPNGLPTATPWRRTEREIAANAESALRSDLFHLRKLEGWLTLESPANASFAYELVLTAPNGDEFPRSRTRIENGDLYHFSLRLRQGYPRERIAPRHVYVFTLDSVGNSRLIFGLQADSNHLPYRTSTAAGDLGFPENIPLGEDALLRVVPPLGRDTYFLLTTDEPLANPWVLDYDGFRPRGPNGTSPLEELLSITGGTQRGSARLVTPVGWSIERRGFLSVAGGGIHFNEETRRKP